MCCFIMLLSWDKRSWTASLTFDYLEHSSVLLRGILHLYCLSVWRSLKMLVLLTLRWWCNSVFSGPYKLNSISLACHRRFMYCQRNEGSIHVIPSTNALEWILIWCWMVMVFLLSRVIQGKQYLQPLRIIKNSSTVRGMRARFTWYLLRTRSKETIWRWVMVILFFPDIIQVKLSPTPILIKNSSTVRGMGARCT